MAKDVLGKTVRIDDKEFDPKGAKFEVWTKGRHKYIKWYRNEKSGIISTENYIDNDKISASLTDDEVIKAWLSQREAFAKFRPDLKVYKVIQDPYSDEPITKRVYGDGKSPYYLNNGCSINIEWRGDKPNPDFVLGTFSNPEDAEDYYGRNNGPNRYLETTDQNPVILTSSTDDANDTSKLPTSSWVIEGPFTVKSTRIQGATESVSNYRDKSYVWNKVVTVNMPTGFTENGGKGHLVWTNHGLQYDTKALPKGTQYQKDVLIDTDGNIVDEKKYDSLELDDLRKLRPVTLVTQGDIITHFGNGTKDSNIVSEVIEKFKSMVVSLHGISRSDYDLKLCEPDSEACKLIEYKSPLEPPNNTPQQAAINDTPPGPSQSSNKIKLNIQGLFDSGDGTTPGNTSSVFEIKAKTDMPIFTIWTGEIPQTEEIDVFDDLEELDDEYKEGVYSGEEEKMAEFESPSALEEVSSGASFISDPSSTSTYTPDPNAKPGTVVTLPKDYSHTSEQGYNLLNSQWIGDLIASAKSHIGHPTYDIAGTDKGNLGCASAVSMMFYRAFGVHMKDGKAVKAKPTDIGSFGTKGTGEAAGWFSNTSLYQKIPWQEAQPGDIMNTARREPKAGHIGVVIDVKAKDGSWAIVSNSSKGFAGGGGGAVKQNYSVKAWQSVTDRNPTGTFAFRYIGPKLSPGQTA
jgi:hypothetical protein